MAVTSRLPPLVALCGPIGCGKSTLAQSFVNSPGPLARRLRFAEALKSMLLALGLSREQVDGSRKNEPTPLLCGKTPRHAMQTLGTEWGRQCIGENLWVVATLNDAATLRAKGYAVIIDDCRFANEARAVHAAGGLVIAVHRAGSGVAPRRGHLLSWLLGQHASEAGIPSDLIDATINNNGTPQQGGETLRELSETLTPRRDR